MIGFLKVVKKKEINFVILKTRISKNQFGIINTVCRL
jgi:hypothetical protein